MTEPYSTLIYSLSLHDALPILYVLMNSGVFHSGQRELRYMVECATKYVYVDQALPGGASLEERELFLHHHVRSEEHTSELQSREKLVCRLLLEKKKNKP